MIEKSTTFTKSNFGVYKFQMTYQNLTKKQSQYIRTVAVKKFSRKHCKTGTAS